MDTSKKANYLSTNPKGLHLQQPIPGREIVMDKDKELKVIEWHHMDVKKFSILSFTGSFGVRCLIYPMDVLRTRLQLQSRTTVYKGMFDAIRYMIRAEGFSALYKGFWISTPQLAATYLNSSVYEKTRDILHVSSGMDSSSLTSALAGGAATASDQLISVPMDVVSQYLMVSNQHQNFCGQVKNKTSIVQVVACDNLKGRLPLGFRFIRAIYQVDGFRGFYRGLLASAMLDIPRAMVFWASYYNSLALLRELRYFWCRFSGRKEPKACSEKDLLMLQATSGAMAGVMGAICTNPLEMLRLRVQIHRTKILETAKNMIQYEGYHMFTKGLAPRMISAGTYSCLTMLVYEMVKKLCVKPEYSYLAVW